MIQHLKNWIVGTLFVAGALVGSPAAGQSVQNGAGAGAKIGSDRGAARGTDEVSVFKLAMTAFYGKDYRRSLALLQSLVNENPNKGLYWYNLGNDFYFLDDYPRALEAYKKVINLKSPLAPLAWLNTAKCDNHLGNKALAKNILLNLERQNLPGYIRAEIQKDLAALATGSPTAQEDPDLAEGIREYQAGGYVQALRHFNTSLETRPGSEAAMMKGMALLRMGQPEEARFAFNRVLELSPTPEIRDDALYFLRQIKANLWASSSPLWAYLDFGAGYNSDYYENGFSEPMTAAPMSLLGAGVGYHFLRDHPFSFEADYFFQWQEVVNVPDARLFTHTVQAPFYLQDGSWFFQITPAYQFQYLGFYSFLDRPEITVLAQKSFGKADVGVSLDYFQNLSQYDLYNYLNGSTTTGRAYLNLNGKYLAATAFFTDWTENIGDLPYNNGTVPLADHSYGPGGTLTWYPGPRWEIDSTGAYYWRNYFHLATPQNVRRDDRETYLAEKINYWLNRNWKLYACEEAMLNQSTLTAGDVADKNFNKFITIFGITWDLVR